MTPMRRRLVRIAMQREDYWAMPKVVGEMMFAEKHALERRASLGPIRVRANRRRVRRWSLRSTSID